MSTIVSKRYVTLLELLIVIAILALISGVVAIGVRRSVVDQRFNSEVSSIVDDLRLAQNLMMILNADVHVKFMENPNNEGISFWLESEINLPPALQREIFKKRKKLTTIRSVGIDSKEAARNSEGLLDLLFLSRGTVMTRGILRLALSNDPNEQDKTLQTFICLPGYPRPIVNVGDRNIAEKQCQSNGEADQELTSDTMQRLPDNLRKKDEPEVPESKETPFQPRRELKKKNQEAKEEVA